MQACFFECVVVSLGFPRLVISNGCSCRAMPLSPAIADPDELGAALAAQCFSQAKIPVDGNMGIDGEQTSWSFLMQPVPREVGHKRDSAFSQFLSACSLFAQQLRLLRHTPNAHPAAPSLVVICCPSLSARLRHISHTTLMSLRDNLV